MQHETSIQKIKNDKSDCIVYLPMNGTAMQFIRDCFDDNKLNKIRRPLYTIVISKDHLQKFYDDKELRNYFDWQVDIKNLPEDGYLGCVLGVEAYTDANSPWLKDCGYVSSAHN